MSSRQKKVLLIGATLVALILVHVNVNDVRLLFQLLFTIPVFLGLSACLRSKRSVISNAVGILLIGFALMILGFIVWLVIDQRLNYGRWELP